MRSVFWLGMVLALAGCSATDGSDVGDDDGGNGDSHVGDDDLNPGGPGGQGNDSCVEFVEAAANQVQPADIILAIDQSGSMDTETNWVVQQLNGFAAQITASGIDAHVIVIAGKPGSSNGFCVPAPLGSGACPADDNMPLLQHVDEHIGSHDALEQILNQYPSYASQLRADSVKHVIVITDDDAEDVKANQFDLEFKQLGGGITDDYVFHGIIADDGNCQYAADEGVEYKQLIAQTGGVLGDLCQQSFQPVWDEVSTQVVGGAMLGCSWDIPTPSDGETLDPEAVNVDLSLDGGAAQPLGHVESLQFCANVAGGWYYDDPVNPTKVVACPDTCDAVQASSDASVSIKFGCATIAAPPK